MKIVTCHALTQRVAMRKRRSNGEFCSAARFCCLISSLFVRRILRGDNPGNRSKPPHSLRRLRTA